MNIVADPSISVTVDMCPTNCKWCTAAAVAQVSDGVGGESVTMSDWQLGSFLFITLKPPL